jgi:adenylate cyclase
MILPMLLPAPLAWLIDKASAATGPDQFLAALGARLIADGLPLAGGALTLAAPHPIIARRSWLWRAESGVVIEALGFGALELVPSEQGDAGREWLAGLGTVVVQEDIPGSAPDDPVLGWAASRALTEEESALLHEVARFAAAPLATLAMRSTLTALLEAYLGRRSAAQVLRGKLRREMGETLRAVLLYGDLRGFTEFSESMPPDAVVAALGAWFDRIAGAVHAFGGEVLKFIGDGVLAVFPVGDRPAAVACDAALSAAAAAHAGMAHLDQARTRDGLPPLPFGMALHLGEMLWGNIGTADRLDFTAIGPAVNLVSRLEGLCRPLGRSLLVSGAVAAETTRPLIPLGDHALRGIATPCAVFTPAD